MARLSSTALLEHKARNAGLEPDEYEKRVSALLYRRGFLLTHDRLRLDSPALPTDSWSQHRFGQYKLSVHTDAHHVYRQSETVHISVVGHAFDPVHSLYTDTDILESLVRAHGSNMLDAAFDTLAGRYRVIVIDHHGAYVWHDPMGAASVFYTERGGACASHAELLARSLDAPLGDWFVPFLTSPNYRERDVKYLPGLLTPFENILQLTPNTALDVSKGDVRRFWPTQEIVSQSSESAVDALATHLSGLKQWSARSSFKPLLGLTGGTDSRGILAACLDLSPTLFTYVYSAAGDTLRSDDVSTAQRVADHYALDLNVIPVSTRKSLNDVTNPIDEAFRRSTAYYRGNADHWVPAVATLADPQSIFIRGFGGEILRGFYQGGRNSVNRLDARQLARAYDVNAGSALTRGAFDHFIEHTAADVATSNGLSPDDLLYWEHRMGTWGAVALSQSELAFPTTVAYSSRHLYETFLGLDKSARSDKTLIHTAFDRLRPGVMTIPTN